MKIRDNPQFKNNNINSNKEALKVQNDAIKKLCEEFDISIEEANEILIKIENNELMKQTNEIPPIDFTPKKRNDDKSLPSVTVNKNESKKLYKQKIEEKPTQNVDDLISDIVPDYSKILSIELENVNLTFELNSEKIDTLKETFIRTIKRNKSKKTKFRALQNISFKNCLS